MESSVLGSEDQKPIRHSLLSKFIKEMEQKQYKSENHTIKAEPRRKQFVPVGQDAAQKDIPGSLSR